ncbi:MAG: PilZ domain-containing protein, partial [Acidobacteria bacterium]|nr:PilZ domain-containing protein [Acidobacteriota bacterium]
MDAKSEKRVLARYPVDFGVICRSKGQEQPGRALNLSRGGVLVSTPNLIPAGKLIEVTLTVLNGELIQFKG